jgi:hypothetical protein
MSHHHSELSHLHIRPKAHRPLLFNRRLNIPIDLPDVITRPRL